MLTNTDRSAQVSKEKIGYHRLMYSNALSELKQLTQWAVYRVEHVEGKAKKIPHQANRPRRRASHSDPRTWATFDDALHTFRKSDFDGLVFAFSEEDSFVGIDLDNCIVDGQLEPWAKMITEQIASYTELSPSGNGLHIILKGKLPGKKRGRKKGNVEVYEALRFFTVTGKRVSGEVEERQTELASFFAEYFPLPKKSKPKKSTPIKLDDHKLLSLMFSSKHGAMIETLWNGDFSAYPSHSEADLALLNNLAWWSGYDRERAAELFRYSGLYREKWERDDYREELLNKAFS